MSKSKYPVAYRVDVEFWGLDTFIVRARSAGEAKAKARKMVREGKKRPKIQSISAERDAWED